MLEREVGDPAHLPLVEGHVGLRGYGADGLPDSGWRGRNDDRNAAFAGLLFESGLRLWRVAGDALFKVRRYVIARAVAEIEVSQFRADGHWTGPLLSVAICMLLKAPSLSPGT